METLWQLEANIDDMNPQNMEYVFSQILDKGANDVWAMPMMMKKGRMASMLCVLCRKEILDDMIETIVKETTSIGVRFFPVSRMPATGSSRRFVLTAGTFTVKSAVTADRSSTFLLNTTTAERRQTRRASR